MGRALVHLVLLVAAVLLCACAQGGHAESFDAGGHLPAFDVVFVHDQPVDRSSPVELGAPGRDSGDDCCRPSHDSSQPASERCSPWSGKWTFSAPVLVSALNSAATELEPYLTRDELTIYFYSDRAGGAGQGDIYTANRSSLAEPFANVQPYASVNTASVDSRIAVALDGLTAFITTNRPNGKGGSDIWIASRTQASTAPWTSAEFQPLAAVNTTGDEFDPYPSADGLTLYFEAQDASFAKLLVSRRSSRTAAFGAPAPLPGADTTAREGNPAISEDGLVMLFNSTRSGGQGSTDIWYMTRTSAAASFSAAQPLTAVNSPSAEGEIYLAPDGCMLYFASDRAGGQGAFDLYRSKFVRLP